MRMGRRSRRERQLSEDELRLYRPHFPPEVLEAARIVDGHAPFWPRPSMVAVVLGTRVHFRVGIYLPGTARGIALLAHELTHVQQFLRGMTVLGYLWQSRLGYRRNPYEIEARGKADSVMRAFAGTTVATRFKS